MAGAAQAACDPASVEMRGPAGGVQRFTVDVADDPAEQAQGLMFVEKMPMSKGMLFVFPKPKRPTFWMENTLIPLDMIFADVTGTVTKVHSNAKPRDRTLIDGGPDVSFVLEINGGLAARMGITEGTVLRHPSVDPSVAAWACDAP